MTKHLIEYMIPLAEGITGFNVETTYDKSIAIKKIKSALGKIMIITETEKVEIFKNYWILKAKNKNEEVEIWINNIHLVFAIKNANAVFEKKIIDALENTAAYCSNKLWEIKVTEGALKNLNKHELKQIKYWNPKTLGEIIFNNWD